jgi:hypothetical protein
MQWYDFMSASYYRSVLDSNGTALAALEAFDVANGELFGTFAKTDQYKASLSTAQELVEQSSLVAPNSLSVSAEFVKYCFLRYRLGGYITIGSEHFGSGPIEGGLPAEWWHVLEAGTPLIVVPLHTDYSELIGPAIASYAPVTQIVFNDGRIKKARAAGLLDSVDYEVIVAESGMAIARCAIAAKRGRILVWSPDVHVSRDPGDLHLALLGENVQISSALDVLIGRLKARAFHCDLIKGDEGWMKLVWQPSGLEVTAESFARLADKLAVSPGSWFGWYDFANMLKRSR